MFTFRSEVKKQPKLMMHYVTVPKDIVDELGGVGTRLLCSINGNEPYQCGMTALGGGAAYIALNKKRMQSYGVKYGEDVEVVLQLDDSKYGFDVPEEFEALLEQDDEGARLFEELTDGQKRYIIYYVSQVKSSQLKIDRSIMMINNLKTMPKDKFDFRHLLGKPPREV